MQDAAARGCARLDVEVEARVEDDGRQQEEEEVVRLHASPRLSTTMLACSGSA
jgi:hypothetical protein